MMNPDPATTGSTRPLGVVLVGCGGFARNYLGAYRDLADVRVVACVDADPAAARAMAERLGAAAAASDFEAAVAAEADYAVVSTPNDLHLPQARALLRAGKDVLLQKPITRNLAEARELLAETGDRPGRLGVYMSMLDFGLWWELRDRLAGDRPLGDVAQVSVRLGHTGGIAWGAAGGRPWRLSRERTGGGAFLMLGVHYVHFIRWLLGRRITRLCASAVNLHCPRIEGEDLCVVQGELDNGTLFDLTVAWNSHGEHVALYGTGGSLVYLDNELMRIRGDRAWKTSYFDYHRTGTWQTFPGIVPPPLDDSSNAFNQHRAFAASRRDRKEPAVDVREGFRDLLVTDAVYRSAATGRWVEVSHE